VLEAYPQTERGDWHVRAFKATALAGKPAEEFELADLEGFIEERGNLKTCSKDLLFLKRACAYAKAKGRIERHYFERLAGDKVTRRRLMPAYNPAKDSAGQEIPDADLEAIFSKLSPRARRAVLFARSTGCRLNEVASLHWQIHRVPEGFAPIQQKGSGTRLVPYDKALLGGPGIGLVFPELGSTPEEIRQSLQACWRYAVKAAKVRHYRFHDLRHTFGTVLRTQGRSFSDIAAIMGITELMAHVCAHEDRKKIQVEAHGAATSAVVSKLAELA
jgi:integrase